ncbi:hypothetical protein CRG98_009304 [Punica granatum]|uniref:DUF4283 domain-containing protein n=1 Tax=Punica granatum TaxID=22663 RepID=A0A2I0KPA3_PUNGR|nr:hypothetical protein CRG98_009304 [Punica granatum]
MVDFTNKLCPKFLVTETELEFFHEAWRDSLIIKVGEKLGYTILKRCLLQLWMPKGDFILIDLSNDYFIKFSAREDRDHALSDGPWTVQGHFVTVREWVPDFQPNVAKIDRVAVWVHIPNLPIEYQNETILQRMGYGLVRPLKIDRNTVNSTSGLVIGKRPVSRVQWIFKKTVPTDIAKNEVPEVIVQVGASTDGISSPDAASVASAMVNDGPSSFGPWMIAHVEEDCPSSLAVKDASIMEGKVFDDREPGGGLPKVDGADGSLMEFLPETPAVAIDMDVSMNRDIYSHGQLMGISDSLCYSTFVVEKLRVYSKEKVDADAFSGVVRSLCGKGLKYGIMIESLRGWIELWAAQLSLKCRYLLIGTLILSYQGLRLSFRHSCKRYWHNKRSYGFKSRSVNGDEGIVIRGSFGSEIGWWPYDIRFAKGIGWEAGSCGRRIFMNAVKPGRRQVIINMSAFG